jgi:hypothetical protein
VLPVLVAVVVSADVRAFVRGTGSVRQTLSNAGVGVLFLLSQVVLRGVLVGVYAAAANAVPWKLADGPGTYAVAFLLIDFVYYVQHRLEHRVPLLWAIHAVHHQSRDYNLSVSFRVGVFASIPTALFHATLALFGVSTTTYALVAALHAALLFGLHARTRLAFGPGRVFNAPVFHRVHHGAEEAYIDRNFGGVLLVFDRLLGSFAPYVTEPTFGVAHEDSPLLPIAANVAPWTRLFEDVRLAPSMTQKLNRLFVQRDAR